MVAKTSDKDSIICDSVTEMGKEAVVKEVRLEPGWLMKGLLLWLLASLICVESRGILTLFTDGAWIRGSIGIATLLEWGVYKVQQKRRRKIEIISTGGPEHGQPQDILPS